MGEEDADVVAAYGVVAAALRGGFRAAQRGEQEEDSGEMEGAETHCFHFRRLQRWEGDKMVAEGRRVYE